jgi:hypothetical protein
MNDNMSQTTNWPEGWTAEKQARYEAFLEAEKAAAAAAGVQREAERAAMDSVFDASVPEAEAPPPDPWTKTLAKIEISAPVPDAIARTKTHINVSTAYLEKLLGISRNRNNQDRMHDQARLAEVMASLGWTKPANVWLGSRARDAQKADRRGPMLTGLRSGPTGRRTD